MIKDKLKEIRENVSMSKKEFANYLGLKYSTYNSYESGAREPNFDFLVLISKKFDISTDYILGLQRKKENTHTYQLKAAEYKYIQKYRSLDDCGRQYIDSMLDREIQRVQTISQKDNTINNLQQQLASCSEVYIQKTSSAVVLDIRER